MLFKKKNRIKNADKNRISNNLGKTKNNGFLQELLKEMNEMHHKKYPDKMS